MEIMMLKARIAEERRRLSDLELVSRGMLAELRLILDPYADPFEELDLEKARVIFEELYRKWREGREVKERLSRMEKDLGDG